MAPGGAKRYKIREQNRQTTNVEWDNKTTFVETKTTLLKNLFGLKPSTSEPKKWTTQPTHFVNTKQTKCKKGGNPRVALKQHLYGNRQTPKVFNQKWQSVVNKTTICWLLTSQQKQQIVVTKSDKQNRQTCYQMLFCCFTSFVVLKQQLQKISWGYFLEQKIKPTNLLLSECRHFPTHLSNNTCEKMKRHWQTIKKLKNIFDKIYFRNKSILNKSFCTK